jgi:hypothetical protein
MHMLEHNLKLVQNENMNSDKIGQTIWIELL